MEEAGKEIELLLRLVPDAEEEGQDVSRKPGVDNIVSRVLDSSGSGVEAVVRIVRLGVEQHAGAPGGCRVGRPVSSSGFFALMVFRVSRAIRSLRLSFSIARRILSASHWDVRSRGGGGGRARDEEWRCRLQDRSITIVALEESNAWITTHTGRAHIRQAHLLAETLFFLKTHHRRLQLPRVLGG